MGHHDSDRRIEPCLVAPVPKFLQRVINLRHQPNTFRISIPIEAPHMGLPCQRSGINLAAPHYIRNAILSFHCL
ncbi:hypothetical protein A0H81_00486 [Grifola frondosa]|uniref:Uncharacterized protein n=1 Tax=Grifola frondosa TaxID=5627 RepID=A0A1C7MSI0_GRIFR|nr:hypothetical protein A0H81_00486 [Grifola frondosa]